MGDPRESSLERSASRLPAAQRCLWLGLAGWALLLASLGTFLWGIWGANRPHEVRGTELSLGLGTLHVLCLGWILVTLVRALRSRPVGLTRSTNLAPLLLACVYAALGGLWVGFLVAVFVGNS